MVPRLVCAVCFSFGSPSASPFPPVNSDRDPTTVDDEVLAVLIPAFRNDRLQPVPAVHDVVREHVQDLNAGAVAPVHAARVRGVEHRRGGGADAHEYQTI